MASDARPPDSTLCRPSNAARPARQHPELHPRFRRQAARRPRARSPDPGSGRDLRHGPRLGRFRSSSRLAPSRRVLRHPRQGKHERSSALFSAADRTTGIICDQTIALDGYYASRDYPARLRRVRYHDAETGKTLLFLTNTFVIPALTVAALYKNRWQVELFFKRIKQHLRIKQFYGTSENAVKTQIWIAVSVYVLVAIVRKRLALDASLYTLLQFSPSPSSRKSNSNRHLAWSR